MEDNPFEIDQSEAFVDETALAAQADQQAQDLIAELNAGGEAGDDDGTNGLADDSVEGLIPLCVRHHSGPRVNTATYGYDIASMEQRPWAKPGTDLSQYFNYGFNETSWRAYCAMQPNGINSLLGKAEEHLSEAIQTLKQSSGGMMGGGGEFEGKQGAPPLGVMPSAGPSGGGAPWAAGDRPPQRMGGEHRPRDDRPPGGGFEERRGVFFKTKPCFAFRNGNCPRGEHCQYAHGDHELRPTGGGGGGGGPVSHPQFPSTSGGGGMAQPPLPPGFTGGAEGGVLGLPPMPPMPPIPSMTAPPVLGAGESAGGYPNEAPVPMAATTSHGAGGFKMPLPKAPLGESN